MVNNYHKNEQLTYEDHESRLDDGERPKKGGNMAKKDEKCGMQMMVEDHDEEEYH